MTTATELDLSKSKSAYERACRLMPGGVNSPARAFNAVGGDPIFISKGAGQYIYDLDGNRFLDYIGSWGPMILGHAHPQVLEAIQQAAVLGTSYGAPTERESELAELVMEAVPSIERLRMVSSGTEATMSAIRVARGVTGRDKIIKFAGNYHGHVDSLLVSAGSAAATLGTPDSPGVTKGTSRDTIVLDYNSCEDVRNAFREFPEQIAGIILEPTVGNMGLVQPTEEFVKTLRSESTQHGSVLIFDEVMTGFRVAHGGAQSLLGVEPDMTTLGKIVGGGLPLGVYGGKAELMDQVIPSGKIYQAGTLSGNPLATAAGIATLKILRDDPPYDYLEEQADRLAKGLASAAQAAGHAFQVQRLGSMITLFFNENPVVDWPTADKSDREKFGKYFWGMINEGIYMPCSQFEALFFSRCHTPENIDETIAVAHRVLARIPTGT
jgi:glutamate-1-semialdehyde 2,1-aminomutase